MNYGSKFLHILLAGGGMMIFVVGLAYKTGYFTGGSTAMSYFFMAAGAIVAIAGLIKMKND